MKKIFFILFLTIQILEVSEMGNAQILLGKPNEFTVFSQNKKHIFLSEPEQVKFAKMENGYVWISDIEHVIEKNTGEIFLADGEKPFYMAGDIIPKDKLFELFPYHFYYKNEEDKLGKKINYKLIIKNINSEEISVDITGIGTTRDWDHYKTWEGALRGDGKKTITLKPNEIYTLWDAKKLDGDLPWSGIVLGKTSGDIWVCDYCYLGEKEPDISKAEQMPDLTYEPYLLASFTRGTADWNSANIEYFPKLRDNDNYIKLSNLKDEIFSLAIAFSPGGPYNNLCHYNTVEPSFKEDKLSVIDPVSKKEHLFFGGNYPIMYNFSIPLINDSETSRSISFYLSSNDKFGVDTIAGVWIQNKMISCRVPMISKNSHWKIFSATLKPKEKTKIDFIVIPLGSRWGGMIASMEISSGN